MPLITPGYLVPRDVQSEFGFQTFITPANPAAGAAFSRRTPGDFFELFVEITFGFTTSATVANRTVFCNVFTPDLKVVGTAWAATVQAASSAFNYVFSTSVSTPTAIPAGTSQAPLFPFTIPSGLTVQIGAVNMQVGDQLNGIALVVQQYNTGLHDDSPDVVHPIETINLGVVVSSPTATPTPAAAPLPEPVFTQEPYTVAPAVTAPLPAPSPPATVPTPTMQQLQDAAALGGPVIRE